MGNIKTKSLHVYLFCNNNQTKEYDILASRKFSIGDETYIIKSKCCYLKKINGIVSETSYYVEGNPNPFDLKYVEKNTGLTSKELDDYIGADIFNILIECQKTKDRSKYVLNLAIFCFALCFIQFIFSW